MRASRSLAALAVAVVVVTAVGAAIRASVLVVDFRAVTVLVGIGALLVLAVATVAAGRPGSTTYW